MIDDEHPSSDISARLDIFFVELSQMATIVKEDNVEYSNDDDIGMEMNKQVPLEDLNPFKARLNYN
jgi:hypothetical protein